MERYTSLSREGWKYSDTMNRVEEDWSIFSFASCASIYEEFLGVHGKMAGCECMGNGKKHGKEGMNERMEREGGQKRLTDWLKGEGTKKRLVCGCLGFDE